MGPPESLGFPLRFTWSLAPTSRKGYGRSFEHSKASSLVSSWVLAKTRWPSTE